jgi:hypothetical protein
MALAMDADADAEDVSIGYVRPSARLAVRARFPSHLGISDCAGRPLSPQRPHQTGFRFRTIGPAAVGQTHSKSSMHSVANSRSVAAFNPTLNGRA